MDEQQTDELATRDDLLQSLAEAGGAQAEADALGATPAPAEGEPAKPAEPATEPDEPRIAAVLRAREEAAKKRFDAEDYAAQLRKQAEQEAETYRVEARKRAAEEFEQELQARRRKFEESPTEAIRALGKSPDEIVDAVVREGSPEWKMIRQLEQRLEETSKKAAGADTVKSEFEAWKAAQEAEKNAALVERIKSEFLTQHASAEKLPYTYARYDSPEEVFDKANAIALQWQRGGMVLGKDFDRNDVAEYLESQSKKRLASLGLSPPQVGGVAEKSAGNAPKAVATGTRTLSAATGSERRTSPKPLAEMTPQEERQALIEAAAEARRTGKE